jgi:hypothetical protein
MLPSNMLLLNFILLIDVTFSTPTGVSAQNPVSECYGDISTVKNDWLSVGLVLPHDRSEQQSRPTTVESAGCSVSGSVPNRRTTVAFAALLGKRAAANVDARAGCGSNFCFHRALIRI